MSNGLRVVHFLRITHHSLTSRNNGVEHHCRGGPFPITFGRGASSRGERIDAGMKALLKRIQFQSLAVFCGTFSLIGAAPLHSAEPGPTAAELTAQAARCRRILQD